MPNLTKVFPSMFGHVLDAPLLPSFDATDIPNGVLYRYDTAVTIGTPPDGAQYGVFWLHRHDPSAAFAFAVSFGVNDLSMRPLQSSSWGTWDNSSGLVGAVQMFARSSAPAGWLAANGTAVSRATYARLFAAIGTTFGAGDGSTTFNLPDLRGEFLRGWDAGRGADSGRVFGSAQSGDIQSHTHAASAGGFILSGTGAAPGFSGGGSWAPTDSNALTAATGGSETRPRNIALLACIKY